MSVGIDRTSSIAASTNGISRYDLLLALVPTLLLAGLLVGATSSLSLAHGAALGALPAAALVGYGMFVEAPVESTGR